MVYRTAEKVMGLMRQPLDGRPNKWMGVISHVGAINALAIDSHGRRLLTAGQDDLNVNVWAVHIDKLEKNAIFNTIEQAPLKLYPQLLEGGERGAFYMDLKNFFYYSQIRRKEEHATKAHNLDGKVPLQEVQNLIIALGFYPTLRQIRNIYDEVVSEKQEASTNLMLEDFVKLFVNHRPVYGLSSEDLQEAFETLSHGKQTLSRKSFVEALTNYGEVFNETDMLLYLRNLTGADEIDEVIPENFEFNFLFYEILGFDPEA